MTTEIAIIGDRFMRSDIFEAALQSACGGRVVCRKIDLDWPDVPMQTGRPGTSLEGLKEFLGDPDEVIAHVGEAPILVTHLAPLSSDMLERMPQLEFVAVSRGGPVNIDMAAARARNISVVNAPGRNATAVAEFTIVAILAEIRNVTRGHDALRAGDWRGDLYRADVAGEELCDLTVGVIGYGEIGTRVVRLLRAFGSRVLVADPYKQLLPVDASDGVAMVDRMELLPASDVVTLHARVTPETTGFIDKDAFARMKKGATFVNTARGPMVDYDALVDALASGHLRGAMLETFAEEPVPPESPLLKLPNVTLTPHIAGASLRTVRVAAEKVAAEVRRRLAGEPPLSPC